MPYTVITRYGSLPVEWEHALTAPTGRTYRLRVLRLNVVAYYAIAEWEHPILAWQAVSETGVASSPSAACARLLKLLGRHLLKLAPEGS